MPPRTRQSTCPECGTAFPYRSGKRFCSSSCRKAESQKRLRKANPVNAQSCPATRREQHEIYELAARMAETLYTMPPGQRLGYIEEIIQLARSGQCPRIRKILTMPALIRPDPTKKHLFYQGRKSYCTISQAANRYCRASPWDAGIADVVRGKVPEPPTGEVDEALDLVA
ncbi:hypothetical protein SAMN05444000_1721 [Shimia gijangensis]|uniref:Uncharacterized protein n=2 Tax=Shimia gijangensis TaxID=1470563 RepID=A0A1M6UIM7_9RHOB|nr:hypothetical protein SAMN05444000_1721 [Shimia gijangensis]